MSEVAESHRCSSEQGREENLVRHIVDIEGACDAKFRKQEADEE